MSIVQSLENITQTGTSHNIEAMANNYSLSDTTIICITVLLLFVLFIIYKIVIFYIQKSCIGCKRLLKCESEIRHIKRNL